MYESTARLVSAEVAAIQQVEREHCIKREDSSMRVLQIETQSERTFTRSEENGA